MKEITPSSNLDTTIVVSKDIRSERIVSRLKPQPGHTCYEFDMNDQLMREAKIDAVTAELDGSVRKKVIMRKNCLYVTALNFKNADKKFAKMLSALLK